MAAVSQEPPAAHSPCLVCARSRLPSVHSMALRYRRNPLAYFDLSLSDEGRLSLWHELFYVSRASFELASPVMARRDSRWWCGRLIR
eukprot:10343861-Alexandrium_andersonii.AAC.1